jgi:NitT/TauT family transport system permease protein
MARSFNANRWATFAHVVVPSALPGIFSGLRLGLGQALVGMVISEFLISAAGLGGLLIFYGARFRTDSLLATVTVIAVFAVVANSVLSFVERRVVPAGIDVATEA